MSEDKSEMDSLGRKGGDANVDVNRELGEKISSFAEKMVMNEMLFLKETALSDNESDLREDAELLIVRRMSRLVQRSKSEAGEYGAAGIFTAVAIAVILNSGEPEKLVKIILETDNPDSERYDDDFYSVLSLRPVKEDREFRSTNIPVPLVRDEVLQALKKKKGFAREESYKHDRHFEDDNGVEIVKTKTDVFKALIKLSKIVDLRSLCDLVLINEEKDYGSASNSDYLKLLNELLGLSGSNDSLRKYAASRR